MKFKLITLSIILCLGFTSCSENETPEPRTTRTILVYMMANNSLNSFASKNIESMIEGATSKNLNGGNLIVYYAPAGSPPELLRIKEENGVVKKIHLKDYEKQNSADPDVMRSVIGEVVSQYPADSYGLVLWSHGTAWLPSDYQNKLKAFGQDGNNWMEIDDLAKGLPDDLFDFILFDACYMASVECTYELRNKAEYILASPTETMADGWPYEEMMPQLFATDLQLEKVGETFYNHYLNNTYPYATVSLTKTSELDNLKSVIHDILADKTESDIYSLDPKNMQRLEYLYRSPGMLYDFNDYIKQLATAEQYDRFISCLDKAVVYKAHTPKSYYAAIGNALPIKSYCGLTIFRSARISTQNARMV